VWLRRSKKKNGTKNQEESFRELILKKLSEKRIQELEVLEKERGQNLSSTELFGFLALENGKVIITDENYRRGLLAKYGELIANRKYSFGRKSDLPLFKHLIRWAIIIELINFPSEERRNALGACLVELESFLSDEDYEKVESIYNYKGGALLEELEKEDGIEYVINHAKEYGIEELVTKLADSESFIKMIHETSERKKERGNQLNALRELIKIDI
jgi:hypothetical protein